MPAFIFDKVAGIFDWIHGLHFPMPHLVSSSAVEVIWMGYVDDFIREAKFEFDLTKWEMRQDIAD